MGAMGCAIIRFNGGQPLATLAPSKSIFATPQNMVIKKRSPILKPMKNPPIKDLPFVNKRLPGPMNGFIDIVLANQYRTKHVQKSGAKNLLRLAHKKWDIDRANRKIGASSARARAELKKELEAQGLPGNYTFGSGYEEKPEGQKYMELIYNNSRLRHLLRLQLVG